MSLSQTKSYIGRGRRVWCRPHSRTLLSSRSGVTNGGMSDNASPPPIWLQTSSSPWPTIVENDDLALGRLHFDLGSPLLSFASGRSLALPSETPVSQYVLEATFISVEKEAVIRIASNDVIAFRVLDENGLVDLWSASRTKQRSGRATFRATGHKWTDESFLVFDSGERPRFSYFVATSDLCLELVCLNEPVVEVVGPAAVTHTTRVR